MKKLLHDIVYGLKVWAAFLLGHAAPPEYVPPGWEKFVPSEFWAKYPGNYRNLCHNTGPWWRSPRGDVYCATCYPQPWDLPGRKPS